MSDETRTSTPDTPWTRLDAAIDDYVDGYELRDCENEDGTVAGDYQPNEIEQVLIHDAIEGLLGDEEILDLIAEARAYTRETRRAEGRCETCGHPNDGEHWGDRCALPQRVPGALEIELVRLRELEARINPPVVDDFLKAVPLEAAHQVERWGPEHDREKTALDWYWTLGYLLQKAVAAELAEDLAKYRHHVITCGAALLNWHRQVQERAAQNSSAAPQTDPSDASGPMEQGGS